MKQPTHTIKFEASKANRSATVTFGSAVPARTGQLVAEYNRLKKAAHADLMVVTPIEPGKYRLEITSQGDFMGAVGWFVLAGVSLLEWVRADTEVIETRPLGDRKWSLGGSGLAKWELIQPE